MKLHLSGDYEFLSIFLVATLTGRTLNGSNEVNLVDEHFATLAQAKMVARHVLATTLETEVLVLQVSLGAGHVRVIETLRAKPQAEPYEDTVPEKWGGGAIGKLRGSMVGLWDGGDIVWGPPEPEGTEPKNIRIFNLKPSVYDSED